jgi:hypothetical protein
VPTVAPAEVSDVATVCADGSEINASWRWSQRRQRGLGTPGPIAGAASAMRRATATSAGCVSKRCPMNGGPAMPTEHRRVHS